MRRSSLREERGESLPVALVALAVGALLVSPLLASVGTNLRAGDKAQQTLRTQYTTSAGIEYGLWVLTHDADTRLELLANIGTPQPIAMPGPVNGALPVVEAVAVAAEIETSGGSGGQSGDGGQGGQPGDQGGGGSQSDKLSWAIWAARTSGNHVVQISGAGHVVRGGVHSNHDIAVSGAGHQVHGTVRYVSRCQVVGAGNQVPVAGYNRVIGSVEPFPMTWDIADFAPGGRLAVIAANAGRYHHHPNGITFSGAGATIPPGLHYATGRVNLSGARLIAHSVTIVSTDTINISGAGIQMTPYINGLAFFSTRSSGGDAINISGAGNMSMGGVSFAPNGRISVVGAGHTITSALIGDTVKISGAGANIALAEVNMSDSGGVIPGSDPDPGEDDEGSEPDATDACATYDLRSTSGGTTTTVRVTKCGEQEPTVLSWRIH